MDKQKLLEELMELQGYETIQEAEEYYDDNYRGEFESLADYAEQWIEQCGDMESMPKYLQGYIDYDSFGRDCELGGDIFTIDGGYKELHVFRNE